MDSTFLGVLAGFGLKRNPNGSSDGCGIELLNASARVTELLDNLGGVQDTYTALISYYTSPAV